MTEDTRPPTQQEIEEAPPATQCLVRLALAQAMLKQQYPRETVFAAIIGLAECVKGELGEAEHERIKPMVQKLIDDYRLANFAAAGQA